MYNESKYIYKTASQVGFIDPITKLLPRDERSISALLCIYYQQGRIDWSKVPVLDLTCQPSGLTAENLLGQAGILCSEYTLFWATKPECDAYGDMRPDFLYLSKDGNTVAIMENKLGAGDTHAGDHYGGQFGRYIQYLKQAPFSNRYMILLTSNHFLSKPVPWYATELRQAEEIQQSEEWVHSIIIRWEDVLAAFKQ